MPVSIRKGKALDYLNLTPLIDVVFLLLIFFLVATRFAQEDRELPVDLPSAANALPMTITPDELVVNIDTQGQYSVHGRNASLEEIDSALQQASRDNPNTQVVVIRTDKNAPVQWAVHVVDLCLKNKISSYRFATEAAPES